MTKTPEESLKGAFAALLRGDTAERDRLCERGEKQLRAEGEARATAKVLEVDFYVNKRGVAYSSRALYAATH